MIDRSLYYGTQRIGDATPYQYYFEIFTLANVLPDREFEVIMESSGQSRVTEVDHSLPRSSRTKLPRQGIYVSLTLD